MVSSSNNAAYNIRDSKCPSRQILDVIADKWTTLIIVVLAERPHRYGELQRTIMGVSHKMLSQTLRELERKNLVKRKVYPSVPPQVEYSLTPLGDTLIGPLTTLAEWAEAHVSEMQETRELAEVSA